MENTENENITADTRWEEDTAFEEYLFHQGTHFFAWKYLGCHCRKTEEGTYAYTFRVWAPNACAVCVVGDISDWNSGEPMHRKTEQGVWELTLVRDTDQTGTFYKYAIMGQDGQIRFKSDPYAIRSETLEKNASIIWSPSAYTWHDQAWMRKRKNTVCPSQRRNQSKTSYFYSAPMHIYEMHLGSWQTVEGASTKDGEHYLPYRTVADRLAVYLQDMGYTHVELMPIMEHPFDGSWGYQICGYYAPTARYGIPEDFQYFVDTMHSHGIGVLLDWVPAHFPKDLHGLYEFDGQPLYEYQGWDRMEHEGWGTRCFDVGRSEVQSFLISNALYWLREYHVDGLRVDAVASMLYLDYDRRPGEWIPAPDGSNRNREAIAFFQKLNRVVREYFPDALMIAEESTDWPMITAPESEGGLGFSFKWNMGWANDMFAYMQTDPVYRKYEHNKLTFPLMYAFSEHYILPVSHDEVVHGKKSLVDKMFGDYDSKFAGMRTFLLYMMTLPGKKLTFMGCEFAQFREWDYENSLEWFLTEYPRHGEMQRFCRALNRLYLESPPLWEIDDSWDGFSWIEPDQADWNVISYRRRDKKQRELVIILNFSPVVRENYTVYVPKSGRYEEIWNTDRYEFGGKNVCNPEKILAKIVPGGQDGRKAMLTVTLPALGGIILRKQTIRKKEEKRTDAAEEAPAPTLSLPDTAERGRYV